MYRVRINGQIIGPIDTANLLARSKRWQRAGVTVEVAAVGSSTFVPLDKFLATTQTDSRSPTSVTVTFGLYDVRVNGRDLGRLDHTDLIRRASRWSKQNATVEVAPAGTGAYRPFRDGLVNSDPSSRWRRWLVRPSAIVASHPRIASSVGAAIT